MIWRRMRRSCGARKGGRGGKARSIPLDLPVRPRPVSTKEKKNETNEKGYNSLMAENEDARSNSVRASQYCSDRGEERENNNEERKRERQRPK